MNGEGNESSILTPDDRSLVQRLTSLPHKILRHHDLDGLSELVLHELGHEPSFGIKRATYLVDNPDFDHLVGVAGFCKDECKFHQRNLWDDPLKFRIDMQKATFAKSVKEFLKNSFRRREIDLHKTSDIHELGHALGMKEPHFLSWHMKHGNHGLLIYEKENEVQAWHHDLLTNISSILSLCAT